MGKPLEGNQLWPRYSPKPLPPSQSQTNALTCTLSLSLSTTLHTEYVSQLAWYDSVLRADDYVLGATIYQLDIPGWGDYSLSADGVLGDLISYCNSQ